MALSSRRRAPREAGEAAIATATAAADASTAAAAATTSKTRKRARVEEAAPAASNAGIAGASALPLPSTTTIFAAPPPPIAQRSNAAAKQREHQHPLDSSEAALFDSAHRDYISARRPGRRVGTSATFAAAAEPLRCSNDEVEEARAALSVLPPKRANAKAQRRAAIEARFPQWREWMRCVCGVGGCEREGFRHHGFGGKKLPSQSLVFFSSSLSSSSCSI